jgi:hypothetical protein
VTVPIIFERDFDGDSDRTSIGGMVVLDRFVQRCFVQDVVLLSNVVIPPHLEGTGSELETLLDLRNALSVRNCMAEKGGPSL